MKRYSKYKDSGVEWIGEIPIDWNVRKLKSIANILNGSTPKSGIPEFWDGEIIWVTPSDISKLENRLIDDSERKLTEEGFNSCGTRITPIGSIILTTRAPIGNVAISNRVLCTNQGCKSISPNKINSIFLYYFISIAKEVLQSLGSGTTFLELSSESLRSFAITVPSIENQEEIVRLLDTKTSQIDQLISNSQNKINLLKEKRTALINHAVTKGLDPKAKMKDSGVEWIGEVPEGWQIRRLGYYSAIFRGAGYQYINQIDESKDGKKEMVIRISDFETFSPILCEYFEQFENYRIKPENILLGGTGHYFGKSIFVTKEMEGMVHSYNIIRIEIKSQIPRFVQFYLSSHLIREQMNISALGSGQPFIDLQGLKDLLLIMPPLLEQQEIVSHLEHHTSQIDKEVSLEERRIELLKEYRQSLISEVVTGKINVLDYAD